MSKEIIITPAKCTGCSTCVLECSFANSGEFSLNNSHITITRDEFAGRFLITFSSTCRGCKKCALVCPSGALRLVDIP